MKKIYNYFINYDKHIKNKKMFPGESPEIENSLKQGNALLKNRRKFLNNLEYNLIHYNRNIVEGFKEGLTNPDLSGFTADDAALIEGKIADFNEKKSTYNTKLTQYETDYTAFIKKFEELKAKVKTCKTECETKHDSNTERGEQDACSAGCSFKGPYIKEAENTFIEKDTTDNYTCPALHSEVACSAVNLDSKGTSILKGCHVCGGGRFGRPKHVTALGAYIQNCTQTGDFIAACEGATGGPTDEEQQSIVNDYTGLSTTNQELLDLADEILEIVKSLKTYNINLVNDKITLLSGHQEDAETYKSIQNEIDRFTKRSKYTLDMKVSDGQLKKKAYDLRIYIWLILALGLGFAALNKIRRF